MPRSRVQAHAFPDARTRTLAPFKLIIHDGHTQTTIDLPALDIAHPRCDLFTYGRILLVGARCNWRGPIHGSGSLAVSDHGFVLGAQYREPNDRFHIIPRDGDKVGHSRFVTGKLPHGRHFKHARIIGRGPNLHVITKDGWLRADTTDWFS